MDMQNIFILKEDGNKCGLLKFALFMLRTGTYFTQEDNVLMNDYTAPPF